MKAFTLNLKIVLFSLMMMCTQNLPAQNPLWVNFTNGDMIYDLAETGDILWAATSGGLVMYDKVTHVTTFYNQGNSGIPRNQVGSIAVEPNGNLWLVSEAGLSNYDGFQWRIYDTTNSNLPNQNIYDVAIDQNGVKWLASGAGLISFDGTVWNLYDTVTSAISHDFVSRVFVSPTNEKWIATAAGLDRFDGTNWTFYDYTVAPYSFYNTTDMIFKGNDVFVCTHGAFGQGEGLVHFDGNNWSDYNPSNSGLPYWRTECLGLDTTGNIWIGNSESWGGPVALVMFDGVNWIADSTGLPQNLIHLGIDDANRFFAGTEMFGLSSYDGNNFSKINTSNSGLNLNGGYELCIDDSQDIYTVNSNGFTRFDRQSWSVWDSSQSAFLNSGVFCIARDHSGGTWIGTNEGVVKYDGSTWTRWDTTNSQLTNVYIKGITVDPDNATWVATTSAPFKFDGANWTDYFTNAGSYVNDVYVTYDGDVWMGSPGYGLNRFDRISTWTNYTPTTGGNFQAGALDKNGIVWYGGSNLHRWDGNSWTVFGTADGLPWNFITALAVDTNNILWIGTQSGLSSFDGNSFTNYFVRNSGLTADYISDIDVDAFNNKWICTSSGISVHNENGVVMGVDNISTTHNQQINVFPNPAHDLLTVSFENNVSGGFSFTISDILGKEIRTIHSEKSPAFIDVSSFYPGVYLLQISSDKGIVIPSKFVVR